MQQKRSDDEEPIEVGKLAASDYFGEWAWLILAACLLVTHCYQERTTPTVQVSHIPEWQWCLTLGYTREVYDRAVMSVSRYFSHYR